MSRSSICHSSNLRMISAGGLILAAMAMHGAGAAPPLTPKPLQKYPDVMAADVHARGSEKFDFDVTVSSPYDTPERYADAFRVSDREGKVFGERKLLHDHAGEQPFTRDLRGVRIPPGVRLVVIQARDGKYGYGGKRLEVELPGR